MLIRRRIVISGYVQGVGYRPFVYRQALRFSISGFVCNICDGVLLEAQGEEKNIDRFVAALTENLPEEARIDHLEMSDLSLIEDSNFKITPSLSYSENFVSIPLDYAPCPLCRKELFSRRNRRYRHPFLTCVACGPRYSLLEKLPFDRVNTSMKYFNMCRKCQNEFIDPRNRRYHAQTLACHECGPTLSASLTDAVEILKKGGVVAIKGIGGFQFLCNAQDPSAIARIRELKDREHKPLALLFSDLAMLETECKVNPLERRALLSKASPIVLLRRKNSFASITKIASLVAPCSHLLGCMLPASPLHALLSHDAGIPLVATSANRKGQPMLTDSLELKNEFNQGVDLIVDHDRKIMHRIDDTVIRCLNGQMTMLRLGRGYSPQSFEAYQGACCLGMGAQEKVTVALAAHGRVNLSPHLGDLTSNKALEASEQMIKELTNLYESKPQHIIKDLHPDYISHLIPSETGTKSLGIQHHHAHILSCVLEHRLKAPLLGITWDGSGFGLDHQIWGGEAFVFDGERFFRVAYLLPFRLLGGEAAIREPRRCALSLSYQVSDLLGVEDKFSKEEIRYLLRNFQNPINSPMTTSMGRFFDGVSSLLGLCDRATYQEEAPAMLEHCAESAQNFCRYRLDYLNGVLDWRSMWKSMILDRRNGFLQSDIALGFHEALAEGILWVCKENRQRQIVLTGGCFQNDLLLTLVTSKLQQAEFDVYSHQKIPPNDGGIAAGQALYGLMLSKG